MTARSNDIVPYLRRPEESAQPLSYRQGEVVTWDRETAENIIKVGEALFENLPCLNTSEASLLSPGDVVGLLVSGSTWAVLGRLIIPGTPEAASSIKSITERIQATEDSSSGTRASNVWGDLTGTAVGPSVTIRVGPSGRALVFWSAEMGQTVNGSNVIQRLQRSTPHVGVQVSGASTIAPSDLNALNLNIDHPAAGTATDALSAAWLQAAMMHLYTGLTPGLNTFTMKYRHDGITPSSGLSVVFEAREIAVFAL